MDNAAQIELLTHAFNGALRRINALERADSDKADAIQAMQHVIGTTDDPDYSVISHMQDLEAALDETDAKDNSEVED